MPEYTRPLSMVVIGALTICLVVGGAAGAVAPAKSRFCKAQAKGSIDIGVLSSDPRRAAAASKETKRLLKAKPPHKVTQALKVIKRAHTRLRAGEELPAESVDAVDEAADVLGEYVASHCLY
jgi:hypothetical protein